MWILEEQFLICTHILYCEKQEMLVRRKIILHIHFSITFISGCVEIIDIE